MVGGWSVRRVVGRVRGRRLAALVVVGLASLAVAVGAVAYDRWAEPELDPVRPAPLAGRDAAFYRFVAPRLAAVNREGGDLAALGERRSRNLLAIQAGQRAVEGLLADLDGYAAEHGVPTRFAAAWATFEAAADQLRRGIAEARSAFQRFDWEAIGAALAVFETGLAGSNRASALLDEAAGVSPLGTPAPATAATTGRAGIHPAR
jgi:hypothetical protein